MSWLTEPVHRTILALDIEGSTRPDRRDSDRLRMRSALYRLLEQVLDRARIECGAYQCTDQGDGILVLLSPEVPKTRVLPWLILRLAAGLNRYNRTTTPGAVCACEPCCTPERSPPTRTATRARTST